MKDKCKQRLIEEMIRQHRELFYEKADELFEAYDAALDEREEEDNNRKFKFNVSVGSPITGFDPNTYQVDSKLSFKVTTMATVSNQVRGEDDLVDQMGKTDEDAPAAPKNGGRKAAAGSRK